jgi:predicted flap endonuclease-1-like 5' DNA nuclease
MKNSMMFRYAAKMMALLAAVFFVSVSVSLAQIKKLEEVEGIGKATVEKLDKAGIKTPKELVDACGTKAKRDALAEKAGVSSANILKWIHRIELSQIKGIGTQYSELLDAAGVATPAELAQRNADNLLAKMTEVNTAKKLVKKLPSKKQLEGWIDGAKAYKSTVPE